MTADNEHYDQTPTHHVSYNESAQVFEVKKEETPQNL